MDSRKRSLFEELRHKMGLDREASPPTRKSARLHGNKNAMKETRLIHLGWIHDGKTVRLKTGGGTRKVMVPKSVDKLALIEESKHIFAEGISQRGDMEMFTYDMLDYSQISMPNDITVAEIYDQTKAVGYLRFYFSTKTKISDKVDDEMAAHQDTVQETVQHDKDVELSDFKPLPPAQNQILPLETNDLYRPLEDSVETNNYYQDSTQQMHQDSPTINDGLSPCLEAHQIENEKSEQMIDILGPPQTSPVNQLEEPWCSFPRPNPDDTIQFGPEDRSEIELLTLEVTETKESVYKFHRSNIFPEMIASFQSDIVYEPMKVELIDELGSDADGLSREIYTLFWHEMYERCEGEYYRVPAISPEFGIEEWKSVANILCKGYIDHRIFPLKLAPVFMIALLDQEEFLTDNELLNSFKLFNNNLDRDLIDNVLQEGFSSLSNDDKDSFLDLLSRCGSHENPESCNAKDLLRKVAHKCLIQMPAYIIKAMKVTVQMHLKAFFPNQQSILKIYEQCKPTPQKVCNLFEVSADLSADETLCFGFLKQFIRGLNSDRLIKVLVLMTASSMISVEKISVRFTKLRGLERRPIFHTCGPVLELPCTYSNYRDLRQEWNSIVEEGNLQMDIA